MNACSFISTPLQHLTKRLVVFTTTVVKLPSNLFCWTNLVPIAHRRTQTHYRGNYSWRNCRKIKLNHRHDVCLEAHAVSKKIGVKIHLNTMGTFYTFFSATSAFCWHFPFIKWIGLQSLSILSVDIERGYGYRYDVGFIDLDAKVLKCNQLASGTDNRHHYYCGQHQHWQSL